MKWKNHFFELTPLGKADKEVRSYLKERLEEHQIERYRTALQHYRTMKLIQTLIRVLFYASIITSIASTFGFGGRLQFLQQIASYIGTTFLLVLYGVTSYITLIRKENYHVQREILISQAAMEEMTDVKDLSDFKDSSKDQE